MKLYLAYKDSDTLMEGTYEKCLGVFESQQKAWDYLKTTTDFEKSHWNKTRDSRVYHFDGELSYHWYVKEVELNEGPDYA